MRGELRRHFRASRASGGGARPDGASPRSSVPARSPLAPTRSASRRGSRRRSGVAYGDRPRTGARAAPVQRPGAAPRAASRADRRAPGSRPATPRRSPRAAASGVGDAHVRSGPAPAQERAARSGRRSENGPGTPGGGTGGPICALTASNTRPSQGLRSRGPHTASATRPPGRRTRRISRGGGGRIGREHEALAADDDVVGAVGLVDAARDPARACSRCRGRVPRPAPPRWPSSPATTSESTTSPARRDEARGGDADAARPARELEHALPGCGRARGRA